MGSNQQKFPDACGDLQQSSHQDMIGNPIWKPFGLISLWGTTFESAHQPGSSFRSLKFLLAKCWCVFFASTRTWSLKTGSYQKLSVFRFMAGAPKAGWDGHPISGVFLRHIWGVLNPKCWNSTPHLPGLQPNKAEIWCIFRCSCWTQNIPPKQTPGTSLSRHQHHVELFGGGKSGRLRHNTKLEIWNLEAAHLLKHSTNT